MTGPLRLVLASANPGKVAEIVAILVDELGDRVELVPRPSTIPDVDEIGDTLVANARLKAEALCAATGLAAVADDTGLEVDALGGAPGVRSARYSGDGPPTTGTRDEANVARLLAELDRLGARSPGQRTARFRTVVVVVWPDGEEVTAEGTVEGRIAEAPRGRGGFGYDPVFVPLTGDGRTFAEMTPDHKHAVSHRGRALRSLAAALLARLDPPR